MTMVMNYHLGVEIDWPDSVTCSCPICEGHDVDLATIVTVDQNYVMLIRTVYEGVTSSV